jgi:DNA polymerase-3 subunit gamma/tau
MAYTVLARKYRSRTFDEVVGQTPIATTLVNAIKVDRIHHGYLFTGTRGVGKTSMARILAKALNCLSVENPTATPCLECDACKSIAEGTDIDVVEIDAASNTGVDNIRELRSNAAYRPARCRYKIYIIDEVHMLSTGAFNALLKTLEEPPEHVKFILATTELQKVPATIQSRCQRFNFRHIGPEDVAKRLSEICTAEEVKADDAVVRRVARLANGSMRDALSILDQLLSVSSEGLSAAVLDEVLPPSHDESVFGLVKSWSSGDVAAALAQVEEILSSGRGLELLCGDCVEVLRSLLLLKACGKDSAMVDVPMGQLDAYVELAQAYELSQYVQMIGLLEELRRQVRFSGAGRALLDAGMVRLAKFAEWAPIEAVLAGEVAESAASGSASGASKKKELSAPVKPREQTATAGGNGQPAASPKPSLNPPRTGSAPAQKPASEDALAESASAPVEQVAPISTAMRRSIARDPLVDQILEMFDGKIVNIEQASITTNSGPDEVESA